MEADGVVEGFDVVKNHGMGDGAARRDEGAEAFGFEGGPEGLHGGVVVAVCFAAHALSDGAKGEAAAEVGAGVLAAAVAVVDNTSKSSVGAGLQGAVESGGGERGVERIESAPADDAAAKSIHLSGEIEPALGCLDIGYIGEPDLVEALGSRATEEVVGSHR